MFLIVDRTMVRAGVHRMLEQGGRFRIVGAAADPLSALPEFLESRSDLVVCAFYRELQPAVGWLAPLKQARPTCRVLLLEEHESQAGRVAFLDGGVDAVIPAAAAPNELLLALDSIRRGYPYLSPALAGRIREESQRSSTEG